PLNFPKLARVAEEHSRTRFEAQDEVRVSVRLELPAGAERSVSRTAQQTRTTGPFTKQLARHPEVHEQSRAVVELSQQVLAMPRQRDERTTRQLLFQKMGCREEHVAWSGGDHRADRPTQQQGRNTTSGHLHFGQFRHAEVLAHLFTRQGKRTVQPCGLSGAASREHASARRKGSPSTRE